MQTLNIHLEGLQQWLQNYHDEIEPIKEAADNAYDGGEEEELMHEYDKAYNEALEDLHQRVQSLHKDMPDICRLQRGADEDMCYIAQLANEVEYYSGDLLQDLNTYRLWAHEFYLKFRRVYEEDRWGIDYDWGDEIQNFAFDKLCENADKTQIVK